jgi:sorting nexin-1/2
MSSLAFGENPEENPFADPFARPRSPDPWTSFRAPEPESEPETKQSDEDEATHSASEPQPEPEPPSLVEPLTPKNEDPLESQILREPSPPPPPGRRAPFAAYREPTPPPTEPSNDGDKTPKRDATPTQTPTSPSTPSQASKTPEPKPASPPPQREASPPPQPSPPPPPQQETQRTPVTPQIQTPLDSPLPPSTYTAGWGSSEQTQFASLSLGGETPGLNWKPPEPNLEESTFVNGESKDDDDTGDDEPLANVSPPFLSFTRVPDTHSTSAASPGKEGFGGNSTCFRTHRGGPSESRRSSKRLYNVHGPYQGNCHQPVTSSFTDCNP